MSELRLLVTGLTVLIVLSSVCVALAEIIKETRWLDIVGIFLALVLMILGIPAWIYVFFASIILLFFGVQLDFVRTINSEYDPWAFLRFNSHLVIICILWWLPEISKLQLPRFLVPLVAIFFPSDEARKSSSSQRGSSSIFGSRVASQANLEEAERSNLAAELDETIAELERTQHEIKRRQERR